MPASARVPSDDSLLPSERKAASDLKREGWRGIMKAVESAGQVLVTNHDRPEAVILSLREYRQLTNLADRVREQDQHTLARLTQAFDDDLAVLHQSDAGERLRAAFDAPLSRADR